MWEEAQKDVESVDRSQEFVAPFIAPGVFDQCHYLMSIQEALMAFYTDPTFERYDKIYYRMGTSIRRDAMR